MLGSSNNYSGGSRSRDFHDVASTALLSHCSDPSVVASVGHSFLDGGVDHDPYPLPEVVGDEQSS